MYVVYIYVTVLLSIDICTCVPTRYLCIIRSTFLSYGIKLHIWRSFIDIFQFELHTVYTCLTFKIFITQSLILCLFIVSMQSLQV